jgi:predicted ATP-dependent endonuclease of OLD family
MSPKVHFFCISQKKSVSLRPKFENHGGLNMKLKVNNVNKIQKAEIHLNGLTVIVGPNNSGKSTVGRTLFSTIKAITNTNTPQDVIQDKQLIKHVKSLYQRLYALSRKNKLEWGKQFPRIEQDFIRFLQSNLENIQSIVEEKKRFFEELDIVPRQKSLLIEDLNNIELCVSYSEFSAARIKTELQYLVESEFINRFCSLNTNESRVELTSEDIAGIKYEVENNIVSKVSCKHTSFIKDATYVESPLYIHLLDALLKARTYREIVDRRSLFTSAMVPVHIKDLAEKIMMAIRQPSGLIDFKNLKIEDITSGSFAYDKETQQIMYRTADGNMYSPINIASGLKSFGLLQLLSMGEFIGPNHMLIWDEPENHLHPPLLAAFIRALSELLINYNGVALIATHSPVILQEVPKSCVWKITRNGSEVTPSRLENESFGATIGALTREVFELEIRQSGFHKLLENEVNKGMSYEAIKKLFNNELGDEALALIRTLILLRDKGTE